MALNEIYAPILYFCSFLRLCIFPRTFKLSYSSTLLIFPSLKQFTIFSEWCFHCGMAHAIQSLLDATLMWCSRYFIQISILLSICGYRRTIILLPAGSYVDTEMNFIPLAFSALTILVTCSNFLLQLSQFGVYQIHFSTILRKISRINFC